VPSELTLEPVASAPQTARRWVERELEFRERSDLATSAVLGVSELVTNAVLHVRSSIVVRVVDVDTRIRIEVYDHAPRPPDGHAVVVPGARDNESTIGRGLQIVDSISYAWGVSYEHLGKCVWFNPAPEGPLAAGPGHIGSPIVHGIGTTTDSSTSPHDQSVVEVRLIDLPVHLVAHYQSKFFDLRREMTLIDLSSTRTDTVAHRLTVLSVRMQKLREEQGRWSSQVERAIRAGLDRVTVVLPVATSMVSDIREFQRLLAEADEFCRREQLLTLAAGQQEQELRSWYLGEMIAQLEGAEPTAWSGGFTISED
jgi:anti-sigma regulatory factor (Ser/Thr protein kinase)